MATFNQQLTDYQRLPLLSAALFAGIVTLLAGLAFAADHYASIKAIIHFILTAGGTFWFPMLASLACWAVGIGILIVKERKPWLSVVAIMVLEALFLAAATYEMPDYTSRNYYHLIFIGAGIVLPLGCFSCAAFIDWAERSVRNI